MTPEDGDGGGSDAPRDVRVVVVDDDFRVAAIHAAFVDQIPGFRTVGEVHSAAAALDAVRTLHPDLLLLDLYLPDQHGLEVLRRLRTAGSLDVDVIVITAANDVASVRAAMQGGAFHYLLKPFEFPVLREKLEAYLSMRSEIATSGLADQHRVDSLFRPPASPVSAAESHAHPTLAAIEALLAESGEDLSAIEIGARLGVSRATAQRYLSRLETLGRVTMSLRYGATGRPEHRYRGRPGDGAPVA